MNANQKPKPSLDNWIRYATSVPAPATANA